ncbi:MAG: hypothetical protein EOP08_00380 [Proteobacteria bacterium]|nr:MAG: hypothetical protein EOP08_00380 [Pseudomonadota bacterium]
MQLLDRYRRLSDGKLFAVISLGAPNVASPMLSTCDQVVLEAEDGEQVVSQTSAVRGHGQFERFED